jgi:hypothetical protein
MSSVAFAQLKTNFDSCFRTNQNEETVPMRKYAVAMTIGSLSLTAISLAQSPTAVPDSVQPNNVEVTYISNYNQCVDWFDVEPYLTGPIWKPCSNRTAWVAVTLGEVQPPSPNGSYGGWPFHNPNLNYLFSGRLVQEFRLWKDQYLAIGTCYHIDENEPNQACIVPAGANYQVVQNISGNNFELINVFNTNYYYDLNGDQSTYLWTALGENKTLAYWPVDTPGQIMTFSH